MINTPNDRICCWVYLGYDYKYHNFPKHEATLYWKSRNMYQTKNWASSNEALAHKGLNWYAKQLIAKM
jgi:hypothetical protein